MERPNCLMIFYFLACGAYLINICTAFVINKLVFCSAIVIRCGGFVIICWIIR